jgi:hypothetical protein
MLWAMFLFDIVSSFIEKSGKLLTWHDPKTSRRFLLILLVIFIVVTFLPLRFFVILGLLKKFNRGKTYYKRRYTGNKEACKIELRNFLCENGYIKNEEDKLSEAWISLNWPTHNVKKFE